MKCHDCQTRLLNLDDPTAPPPNVAEHLAICEPCRIWQGRLLSLEAGIARLPTPVSSAKAKLVDFFLHPPALPETTSQRQPSPVTQEKRQPGSAPAVAQATLPFQGNASRLRRWARPALAVAAGLLLAALGLWLGQRLFQNDTPPIVENKPAETDKKKPDQGKKDIAEKNLTEKSLAARLVDLDLQLAATKDPGRRLAILADLAETLGAESMFLAHADGAKELTDVARWYDKVVSKGVVDRARAVPMEERQETLDPVWRLLQARGQAADQLARKAPAALAEPLRQVAAAARRGSQELKQLMDEATP
jgi:hypothetical protein